MLLFVVWRNGTPTLMCSLVKRERTLQAREQRTHGSEDGCYDGAGEPTQGDPKKQARVPLRFDEVYCCFWLCVSSLCRCLCTDRTAYMLC